MGVIGVTWIVESVHGREPLTLNVCGVVALLREPHLDVGFFPFALTGRMASMASAPVMTDIWLRIL